MRCPEHPQYVGKRPPKVLCERCWQIYFDKGSSEVLASQEARVLVKGLEELEYRVHQVEQRLHQRLAVLERQVAQLHQRQT